MIRRYAGMLVLGGMLAFAGWAALRTPRIKSRKNLAGWEEDEYRSARIEEIMQTWISLNPGVGEDEAREFAREVFDDEEQLGRCDREIMREYRFGSKKKMASAIPVDLYFYDGSFGNIRFDRKPDVNKKAITACTVSMTTVPYEGKILQSYGKKCSAEGKQFGSVACDNGINETMILDRTDNTTSMQVFWLEAGNEVRRKLEDKGESSFDADGMARDLCMKVLDYNADGGHSFISLEKFCEKAHT